MLEAPLYRVLDAAEDGVPARVEAARHLRPREHPRPARDEPHERVRRLALAGGPGHQLHRDAATRTVHAAHRIDEQHRDAPERHEGEQARRPVVVAAPLPVAVRAHGKGPAARSNVDVQRWPRGRPGPGDFVVDESGLRVQLAQDRLKVHRARGLEVGCRLPCTMHPSLPAPTTGARRRLAGGTPTRSRDASPVTSAERSASRQPTDSAGEPHRKSLPDDQWSQSLRRHICPKHEPAMKHHLTGDPMALNLISLAPVLGAGAGVARVGASRIGARHGCRAR